jgi:hypothetical protein
MMLYDVSVVMYPKSRVQCFWDGLLLYNLTRRGEMTVCVRPTVADLLRYSPLPSQSWRCSLPGRQILRHSVTALSGVAHVVPHPMNQVLALVA